MQPTATRREIDEGQRKIIGVNAYADEKPLAIPILEMDPQGYERQLPGWKRCGENRDSGRVGQKLDELRLACQDSQNVMPYLLEAVHAQATLGEIIGVMKQVFGTYQEPNWI